MNNKFFLLSQSVMMAICSLFVFQQYANAAARVAVRGNPGMTNRGSVQTPAVTEPVVTPAPEPVVEPVVIKEAPKIINQARKLELAVGATDFSDTSDMDFLSEQIRQERDRFKAQDALAATEQLLKNQNKNAKNDSGVSNSCDTGLRDCMTEICGDNFTKCSSDGDSVFGDKLNRCKLKQKCTGEEFTLFVAEIKADRDLYAKNAVTTDIIDCGNRYNTCMINQCSTTTRDYVEKTDEYVDIVNFTKCYDKSVADKAALACKKIADECREHDSGLASRFGTVIGQLRENGEKDVQRKEERMYDLRKLLQTACRQNGGALDERTLNCVYTISFYAGDKQNTLMGSHKLNFNSPEFICKQESFGVDVTTFKENAYRETRSQTGASSSFLGAGLGTAAGLIASGAMDRAIDRQKAENELEEACKTDSSKIWTGSDCVAPGKFCKTVLGSGEGTWQKNDKGNGFCEVTKCNVGRYKPNKDFTGCTLTKSKQANPKDIEQRQQQRKTTTSSGSSSSADASSGGGEELPPEVKEFKENCIKTGKIPYCGVGVGNLGGRACKCGDDGTMILNY